MPALLARLSGPLLATLSCISNCSAEVMPAASIWSLVKEVIGSDCSTSARLMREPVTVTWSRVFTLLSVLVASDCWAIAGMAIAASRARLRRRIFGIACAGMELPPRDEWRWATALSAVAERLPACVFPRTPWQGGPVA